eukprot:CAMPEP_0201578010 /NCGR_PEP_ID=MMETSP0190_2-20130828/24636_1 /ASSEMBLY_ACC=CAM_ASM_000263 /TAXON_ID=37353 /ORGANISM="Rosalina sp." /LENGTH=277 /DNA_ID=CAMNT_0048010683 /DNA_START=923 /DNA_END=1756 /DNA_ORIENTATION=+
MEEKCNQYQIRYVDELKSKMFDMDTDIKNIKNEQENEKVEEQKVTEYNSSLSPPTIDQSVTMKNGQSPPIPINPNDSNMPNPTNIPISSFIPEQQGDFPMVNYAEYSYPLTNTLECHDQNCGDHNNEMMQIHQPSIPMYQPAPHHYHHHHHYHPSYDHNYCNQIQPPNWSSFQESQTPFNENKLDVDDNNPTMDSYDFDDIINSNPNNMFYSNNIINVSPQPLPMIDHYQPPQYHHHNNNYIPPQYVVPSPFNPHCFSYSNHHSSSYHPESSRFAPY